MKTILNKELRNDPLNKSHSAYKIEVKPGHGGYRSGLVGLLLVECLTKDLRGE